MRLDAQLVGVFLLVSGDLVDVQAVYVVQLAATKGVFLRGLQFNGIEVNLVELGRFGVPVIVVFLHDNLPAKAPRLQPEGAIADEILRLGPAAAALGQAAVFLDRRDVHRKPGVMIEQ